MNEFFQRLQMPQWTQFFNLMNNNKGGEFVSGKSDADALTLEELMRQKYPLLFDQYQSNDRAISLPPGWQEVPDKPRQRLWKYL
jgi:hypothetical protein